MTDNLLAAHAVRSLFDREGKPREWLYPEEIAAFAYSDVDKKAKFLAVLKTAITSKALSYEEESPQVNLDYSTGRLRMGRPIIRQRIYRDVMRAWLEERHALESASEELRAWWPELSEEKLIASRNGLRGAASSAPSRQEVARARNAYLTKYVDEAVVLVEADRSASDAAKTVFRKHKRSLSEACRSNGWTEFSSESIRQKISERRNELKRQSKGSSES